MNSFLIQFSKGIVLALLVLFVGCKKEVLPDVPPKIDYGYKVEIQSPKDNQVLDGQDSLEVQVQFLSETNEIIHNIEVRIEDKNSNHYKVQSHIHVYDSFLYSDIIPLSNLNYSDTSALWIIGSAWSHEENAVVAKDSVPFYIGSE